MDDELNLVGEKAISEAARRQQWAQKREAEYRKIAAEFEPVEDCPLIHPYTRFLKVPDKVLHHLYALRKQDPTLDGGFKLPHIQGMNQELPLRRYQELMHEHMYWMPKFICGDGVGLGKAQPLDAKVLTPSGWVSMGDICVGDPVCNPDGGVAYVEGVYPQGERQVYRVTTSDGGSAECCAEHLWSVQTSHDRDRGTERTLSTQELMDQGLFRPAGPGRMGWRACRFFVPITLPVSLTHSSKLPVDPYTIGALIGDGSFRSLSLMFSSADESIVKRIRDGLPDGMEINKCPGSNYDFRIVDRGRNGNRYLAELRALGMWGKRSEHKSIPDSYLGASLAERRALLQGLLDTDGECSKEGLVYYHSSSKELVVNVASLVRSLGGVARISRPRKRFYRDKYGEKKQVLDSYAVTIKTTFCPFYLDRKAVRWKPQILARGIVSIVPTRITHTQCIRVGTRSHLYITDDFLVTHNTLSAISTISRLRNDFAKSKVCHKTIILTTTSTAYQWESEIKRFSNLRPWVLRDTIKFKEDSKATSGHEARKRQLQKFLDHPELNVLICRYSQWLGVRQVGVSGASTDGTPTENGKELLSKEMIDFKTLVGGAGRERLMLVLDETHRIKTPGTNARNLIVSVQNKFAKIIGMTATPILNRLDEFYSIAAAIGIIPLMSLPYFIARVCVIEKKWMRGGKVAKSVITGYRPDGIIKFRKAIRPWYWGRTQFQVKEPMPKLTTVMHPVDLDKATKKMLLDDIPSGTYVLPPALKLVDGVMEWVERDPSNLMTSLSVMQLAANSIALLDPGNPKVFLNPKLSAKEEMLLDLLDGDLEDEKVIVFTKYRTFIDRLQYLTEQKKFTQRKFLRITGAETGKTREAMRRTFQESPDHNLIMINTAGIEGINLQQAAHMICMDLPWSWGHLLQLVGRMVRMASPHSACLLHILFGLGTVDEYVLEVQRSKKGLFERILGTSSSCGLLDDGDINIDEALKGLEGEGGDDRFADMLYAHAKSVGLSPYAFGKILAQEDAGMRTKGRMPGMKADVLEEEWLANW